MKASELAALLMQNPDAELYMETCETPEFNDWYFKTDRITGVKITPSGVFLEKEFIPYEDEELIKSPSKCPVVDSILIKMKDSTGWTYYPVSTGSDNEYISGVSVFQDILDCDNIYGYVDGCHMSLSEKESKDKNMTEEYYTANDIEYISVLTSYDEQWEPTYTNMSYEEAKEYFVKKYELVKYLGDEE